MVMTLRLLLLSDKTYHTFRTDRVKSFGKYLSRDGIKPEATAGGALCIGCQWL
jgi:hypothetical protein